MRPLPSFLISLFLLFFSHFSLLPALPDRPEPIPVQPFTLPASSPPSTIPAFPEQSDVAGSCPLDLPDELFHAVSRACPSTHLSRARCCPSLAAWLYYAYADTALAAAATPPPRNSSSASSSSPRSSDMPVLPDDSEACVDGVEKALRGRGLALLPVNDTCDVTYCYCEVRLRPFSCPGGLAVERDAGGRWVAGGDAATRIERDCALPGLAGCSRCLRSLYQLKPAAAHGREGTRGSKLGRGRDCQLMGLTWLLARNRTLYLPAATCVIRALILTPGSARPLSCTLAPDGLPFAVDSADLDDPNSSSSLPPPLVRSLLLVLCLWWSSPLLLLLLGSSRGFSNLNLF